VFKLTLNLLFVASRLLFDDTAREDIASKYYYAYTNGIGLALLGAVT
jgi:hypothetical protein